MSCSTVDWWYVVTRSIQGCHVCHLTGMDGATDAQERKNPVAPYGFLPDCVLSGGTDVGL